MLRCSGEARCASKDEGVDPRAASGSGAPWRGHDVRSVAGLREKRREPRKVTDERGATFFGRARPRGFAARSQERSREAGPVKMHSRATRSMSSAVRPHNVWHQRRAQRVRCMPGLDGVMALLEGGVIGPEGGGALLGSAEPRDLVVGRVSA